MVYSQDLRIRIVRKVAEGLSCSKAAVHFGVSVRSAIRFVHQYKLLGHVKEKKRGARKRRLDVYGEVLFWA